MPFITNQPNKEFKKRLTELIKVSKELLRTHGKKVVVSVYNTLHQKEYVVII